MFSDCKRKFVLRFTSRFDDDDVSVDFNGMLSFVVAKIYSNQ